MKVALLTDGIYPYCIGGMQKHSYSLAKYLSRSGVEVILYHCVEHGEKIITTLDCFANEELVNIKHKCFSFPKLDRFPGHYLRESFALSKAYKKELKKENDIDLIYAQGFMAWASLKEPKLNSSIPIIVNFHGLNMFQMAPSLKSKLEHMLLKPAVKENIQKADFNISLGGKLTEILLRITSKEKIIINPIGIEKEWLEENRGNSHPLKIVFIGRDERVKGINELNKVLKRLKDHVFEMHIIGPFTQRDRLKLDHVIYHGEIRSEIEIGRILSQMDILVLPSWSEGMPTVILEAMSKSCAIIATDVGAVLEMVDQNNGWLCLPGDIDSLQSSFIKALECSNEELRLKKQESYRRVKQSYTWDKVIVNFLEKLSDIKK